MNIHPELYIIVNRQPKRVIAITISFLTMQPVFEKRLLTSKLGYYMFILGSYSLHLSTTSLVTSLPSQYIDLCNAPHKQLSGSP